MISVFGRFAWPFLCTGLDGFYCHTFGSDHAFTTSSPEMTWGTTSLGTGIARLAWRGDFKTSMMSAWLKQGSNELSWRARRIVQDILAQYRWWRRMWLRLDYHEEETRRNALWQMPIHVFRGFINERLWQKVIRSKKNVLWIFAVIYLLHKPGNHRLKLEYPPELKFILLGQDRPAMVSSHQLLGAASLESPEQVAALFFAKIYEAFRCNMYVA